MKTLSTEQVKRLAKTRVRIRIGTMQPDSRIRVAYDCINVTPKKCSERNVEHFFFKGFLAQLLYS